MLSMPNTTQSSFRWSGKDNEWLHNSKPRFLLRHAGPAKRSANASCRDRKPGIESAVSNFRDHFDIVTAESPQLMEDVFALRYQVYCEETGFENPADFPDRVEYDDYDKRSVHSLLQHVRTGLDAGTVRLVIPEEGELASLPLHEVTDHPFFRDEKRFPADSVAEVSRFAISRGFRRRLDEFPSPSAAGTYDVEREKALKLQEKRVLPHITLGLFIAMVKMSHEQGIKTWFCVMEKALVRLLARYSLHFEAIGPSVEYHGERQPCYADIDQFLKRLHREQPGIWNLITQEGKYSRF